MNDHDDYTDDHILSLLREWKPNEERVREAMRDPEVRRGYLRLEVRDEALRLNQFFDSHPEHQRDVVYGYDADLEMRYVGSVPTPVLLAYIEWQFATGQITEEIAQEHRRIAGKYGYVTAIDLLDVWAYHGIRGLNII